MSDVFHKKMLVDLVGDDYKQILQIYLEKSKTQIDRLQTLVDLKNVDQAGKMLHSIKGAAAQIGACRFNQLLSDIETDLKSAAFDHTSIDLESILKEYEILRSTIEKEL